LAFSRGNCCSSSQLGNAQTRFGTISDNLSLAQRQRRLRRCQLAQVIEPAAAPMNDPPARAHNLDPGRLIGVDRRYVVAIIVDTRSRGVRLT
jgi:hypothetical protein